ncbi:MAG TPA: ABC transporter ATP-binding protein [Anaerolineales bacterium]|nr:ABC transporter ATP-binding protein [Anaerolineales bacterium]
MSALLQVNDLRTRFHTPEGTVYAVNGISFHVDEGETLAVVGESGCGKSVSMLSVLKLIPTPPGEIAGGTALFSSQDLLKKSEDEMTAVRGKEIAMIFQDPMTSLNPVLTIGKQITESLRTHMSMDQKTAENRAVELLELVGIPEAKNRLGDYPHQFSGGMRQRVMIAMALACNPGLLIADEPTTALDVTIQAQIVELVTRLRDQVHMAVIWITHDLGVVAGIADRVIVMYAGFIVEEARVEDLYEDPRHPYTQALLGALPRVDRRRDHRLKSIAGAPPSLLVEPHGCPFAPRCDFSIERCKTEIPSLSEVGSGHTIACWVDIRDGAAR